MTPLEEAADRLHRAAIGAQKIAQIDSIAAKHRPKISAFFRRQRDITLEKFRGYEFLFTESYRQLREETRPNEFLTTHDWDRLWREIDRDTFDDLQRIIAEVEGDGVLKGGELMQKMVNPAGKFWDLKNPRAVAWFQANGGSIQYIRGINDTTSNQIRKVITHAIDTGQSYQQTAKDIADTFDGMSRERAQRIAVNEATHAYENGNLMFAQCLEDDGVEMEKAWNTSADEKVCDTCLENEAAGYILLDEAFPSGHQVPPSHLGDRCYLTYRQAPRLKEVYDPSQPRDDTGKWIGAGGSSNPVHMPIEKNRAVSEKFRTDHGVVEYHERNDLTVSEKTSIQHYTSEGSPSVNEAMRGTYDPDHPPTKETRDHAREINNAVEKSGVPEKIVLHRGIGEKYAPALNTYKVGEIFEDKGFQSFSINPSVSHGYMDQNTPIMLKTVIGKGQKGLWIGGSKGEMVLPPGRWKISSIQERYIQGKSGKITKAKVVGVKKI